MENTLSHFQVSGLEIKLTEDKLFINTSISNEAFALRSVDGIGIVDLVQNYNEELADLNYKKMMSGIFIIVGIVVLLVVILVYGTGSVTAITEGDKMLRSLGFIAPALIFLTGFGVRKTLVEPTLKSSVRIMMSGGNRDFMFDKADTNSNSVAEFVAKVENTLTAFHKKNS